MNRIFICLIFLLSQCAFAQTQGPGCLSPDALKGKTQGCTGEDPAYKTPVTNFQSDINPECFDVCKYGGDIVVSNQSSCKNSIKAKKKSKDGFCCCTLGLKGEEVRR